MVSVEVAIVDVVEFTSWLVCVNKLVVLVVSIVVAVVEEDDGNSLSFKCIMASFLIKYLIELFELSLVGEISPVSIRFECVCGSDLADEFDLNRLKLEIGKSLSEPVSKLLVLTMGLS